MMPLYCYRFKGDKATYYGPLHAENLTQLMVSILKGWKLDSFEGTVWETTEKDYVRPPAPEKEQAIQAELSQLLGQSPTPK